MTKKITMADIAEMAGVTKSTVSRYFNGGYVKESTKERIQQVIRENNYEPNTFARLKAKDSNVIGVVLPTLNSKVTSRVITSIDRYLRERGYATLIKNSDHDVDLELQNMQRLLALNVDGILLSAITITPEHKKIIERAEIPILVIAQDYTDGICVVDDDYEAGKYMGNYVGAAGHKKVGYICVHETDEAVGVYRKNGVLDGLREQGITDPILAYSDYSYEGGKKATQEILKAGSVDAIICATDRLAFGAYYVLEKSGLKVPEDVSVTGFGGYDESALLNPELTTLKFDSYGMGYIGAETLLKMINMEPVPKKQIVDYEFINGKSVKTK